MNPAFSVVVLNFNGRELLARFLPSVVAAIQAYPAPIELIVVDDGSSDDSLEFLRRDYPQVRTIPLGANHGFSTACNTGVRQASCPIMVLLNNDIELDLEFFRHLPAHFSRPEVFAVRPVVQAVEDGQVRDFLHMRIAGRFRYGFLEVVPRPDDRTDGLAFITGVGAFHREKFLALGGFDELFNPFYYEDTDLSYRALKRGWVIVSEPRSVMYHYSSSTIPRFFNRTYVRRIGLRNHYFFVWKNITAPRLIAQHVCWTVVRWVRDLCRGDSASVVAFWWALRHLPAVMRKRRLERLSATRSDEELFRRYAP